ncbi:MAG: 5-formyltetrahydrofolate cyclo-ligase [Thermoanaerobaculia bacterium]|nr:5-formyltetrahydrofolate cyclo-ligase [Thermoanaerobaculia bacterium]
MTEIPPDPVSAKATLRRKLGERIAALDPPEKRIAGESLARRVLELPEVEEAAAIFTCLSFGAEIDTWGLVEALLREGRRIYVPRTEYGDDRLHVHPYPCRLETLSFGLRQPRPDAPELAPEAVDETLDVALVLGLGFDRRGVRLGYGRGYFDRFLAGRPFPALGLAHRCQLLDHLPREPHDVPMTLVATDEEVVRPGGHTRREGDPSGNPEEIVSGAQAEEEES